MPKKLTNEEFLQRLHAVNPDITALEEYRSCSYLISVRHETCGYEWTTNPMSLMRGYGCPKCGHAIRKTQDEFEQEVHSKFPHLTVVGTYIKTNIPVAIRSDICGHIWDAMPFNLLQGHCKCAVCDGKQIQVGENDFGTKYPYLVKYLLNPNDATKYTAGSHTKVKCKCPNCGNVKTVELKSLGQQGFACDFCSQGLSYPNRFLRMFLSQLPIKNIIYEYHPDWSLNRKYDCYFEYNEKQYAIEMDGGFHYRETTMSEWTKDQVVKNDHLKDNMAKAHNINIIRINCRYSNQDFIVKHILKSELSQIFNLSKIDWNKCGEFATSNWIKYVCNYFEQNKTSYFKYQIAEQLGIHATTLSDYLKVGTQYGWCDNSHQRYYKS